MSGLKTASDVSPDRRLVYIGLLVAYVSFLVGLVVLHSRSEFSWSLAVWDPDSPNPVVRHVWPVAAVALRDLLLFAPLGFLVSCALGSLSRRRGCLVLPFALVAAMVISWSLAMAVRTSWNGLPIRRPSVPAVAVMTLVTFGGCWAGATWYCSRGIIRWLFGQLVLFTICLAVFAGGLYSLALQPTAEVFDAEPLGTEDRRRLVKLFGAHDPRYIPAGTTDELTLSERDINQLLSWGLALGPPGQKARVDIQPDGVQFRLSSHVPWIDRYLNVAAAGMAFVNDGELAIKPQSLHVGRLAIPRWLLVASGPSIINRAFQNRHTRPFLSSLRNIELRGNSATVTYGPLKVTKDLLSEALVVLGGHAMEPATQDHVEHLIRLAEDNASLEFGDCLRSAFDWARRRAEVGMDPVHENRAAILALGYLLGHERIKSLVGPGLPEPELEIHRRFRRVSLRQRNDWARHFTVSAALEVLSNPATSNMIGLLKEELDADGGSGFSFADLLADNAGTKLAQQVTVNREAALLMQRRLADAREGDYFPPAEDLPEGLSDAEFQQQFGGVGGDSYEQMLSEIDRRISACGIYRDHL